MLSLQRLILIYFIWFFASIIVFGQSSNCMLTPDAGPCYAAISKYYFDQTTQKCTSFIWGGCGGVVPFDNYNDCYVACELGSGSGSNGACLDSLLIDSSMVCIQAYDPVCGCDSVTYHNNCYATFYGGVTSYTTGPCSPITKTLNLIDKRQIKIYPNPALDVLNIDIASGSNIQNLYLFDVSGRLIKSLFLNVGQNKINLKKLSKGLFILQFINEEEIVHFMFVKE